MTTRAINVSREEWDKWQDWKSEASRLCADLAHPTDEALLWANRFRAVLDTIGTSTGLTLIDEVGSTGVVINEENAAARRERIEMEIDREALAQESADEMLDGEREEEIDRS